MATASTEVAIDRTMYTVILTRKNGSRFIASGDGAPYTTYSRPSAVEFKRRLAEHGMKGRVMKVRLRIDPME